MEIEFFTQFKAEHGIAFAGFLVFCISMVVGVVVSFAAFVLSDPFATAFKVWVSTFFLCAACGATVGVLYALLAAPGNLDKALFLAATTLSGALGSALAATVCLQATRMYVRRKTGRDGLNPAIFSAEQRRLWE